MKAHLLSPTRDLDFSAELETVVPNHEALIADLELTTLLATMAAGDRFLYDVCTRVLLTSVTDPDEITYRQRVLTDCVQQAEIVGELYQLAVDTLADKRKLWGYGYHSQFPGSILSGAVTQLEALVVRLKQLRAFAHEHSDRFGSDGFQTLFATIQSELDDEYLQTVEAHLKKLRFANGHLLSAQLGRDLSGVRYVLRYGDLKPRWRELLSVGARDHYSFTIPQRDEAGAQALGELSDRGINLVANAAARSADHITSYFQMLRAELAFYLGCVNLRTRLLQRDTPVSLPVPTAARPLRLACTDLRDPALALRTDGDVVGNDVDADDTPLVIITGANSGGKSTFLRSVGCAQLMMQCGMFVAAERYEASVADGLFTHFLRDEDETMERGRLDEELTRMSYFADQLRPDSTILFNESFAATNEREGSEIARQIVRALLEADVRVLFVTHLYDFASSFTADGDGGPERPSGVLFLRAERGEGGRRPYKLVAAEPLPTSFGVDVYERRLGGSFAGPLLNRSRD
ncbi:MAG TPA: hypothetical protein VFW09_12615 [Solirubrobacteraceae bacterium]|nr:hypothetical protein [Solirubrobacteraceae bacterium]